MKVFRSYKAEFDMACKVMKSMAEEIIKLRAENADLRTEVGFLEAKCNRQGEKISATMAALTGHTVKK